MFLGDYKVFSDFPDDSVLIITKAEMRETMDGMVGFLEYSRTDAKGECDRGVVMAPKRFMDSSPDTLSTPYIIVHRGKRQTPGYRNWFCDVRLVVLSADEKKDVESKASSIRRMSKARRDVHFRIKSLASFEVGSVVIYTSLRMHYFVNNAAACVVAYKTTTQRGLEEGEVFIPEKYKDTMLRSMPGMFIYRGLKGDRKSSRYLCHDLNILSPETLTDVYKTCSESCLENNSGCFPAFNSNNDNNGFIQPEWYQC